MCVVGTQNIFSFLNPHPYILFFFLLPQASWESLRGRGRGCTYPFIDWFSSPPASEEKGDGARRAFVLTEILSCTVVVMDHSWALFPFLPVNDPHLMSTLPGGLLVFEGELCFRGVRQAFEKQFILSMATFLLHFQPSCFSSPGALLLHLNSLLCFHHLLTHPFQPHPQPPFPCTYSIILFLCAASHT